ncbi:MAG: sensor histidine kinase [Haloarculaceae archaeon]
MTGDGPDPGTGGGRARVLLVIDRTANREQLGAWLAERYDVTTASGPAVAGALDDCDLCVVDDATFRCHRADLVARKERSDEVFFPCLLALTGRTPADLDADVWTAVDDVIETPVPRAELRGRIEVLLRARRYSVDLRRRNEWLDRFAGTVSHDLRNPLTVARGFLDLARESDDPDHLDRVDRALDRMQTIVDDVLTLARSGTAVDAPAPVDLAAVAERAWTTVATGEAALDVAAPDGTTVVADESRLIECFENLFRNCVEHAGGRPAADDGADPTDHDVTVRVGTLADGGFYVEDDGPGVPEAEREQVFEYGYTTASDGTGFGLAVVEAIVEAHGWTIRVTDARDGGARFEVACDLGAGDRQSTANAGGDARDGS